MLVFAVERKQRGEKTGGIPVQRTIKCNFGLQAEGADWAYEHIYKDEGVFSAVGHQRE